MGWRNRRRGGLSPRAEGCPQQAPWRPPLAVVAVPEALSAMSQQSTPQCTWAPKASLVHPLQIAFEFDSELHSPAQALQSTTKMSAGTRLPAAQRAPNQTRACLHLISRAKCGAFKLAPPGCLMASCAFAGCTSTARSLQLQPPCSQTAHISNGTPVALRCMPMLTLGMAAPTWRWTCCGG